MENIYLIGFMGTGKSSVAAALTRFLPLQVVEMDSAIEALNCMSISQIFETQGEGAFRDMETGLLKVISKEKNQIISCGGGVILRQENIDLMKESGTVIRLVASAKTVYERTMNNTDRPLLSKKTVEDIEKMMTEREEFYLKAKDFEIECDFLTPGEIAAKIVEILAVNGKLS